MSGNFQTIAQETINPCIAGVMYGGKPRVLARTQDRLLVWVPGYTSYVSRMWPNNSYSPGQLISHVRQMSGHRGITTLWKEGGRLTAALRNGTVQRRIDDVFGDGFHKLLEADKTIVIGDNEPWSIYGHEEPPGPHNLGFGHRPDHLDLTARLEERMRRK